MEERLEKFVSDNTCASLSSSGSAMHLSQLALAASGSGVFEKDSLSPRSSGSFLTPDSAKRTPPPSPRPSDASLASNGCARFIHRQIMELANDCLAKSREGVITSAYFYELSQNLDELLKEVR